MKTDTSIRNISIAAVKRSFTQPLDSKITKIYESETVPECIDDIFNPIVFYDCELPISHTVIDAANWTLVTSRRIICCIGGIIKVANAANVVKTEWGDFKGYNKTNFTKGYVKLDTGEEIDIFLETGKPSLVVIKSINTLVGQLKSKVW